MPNNFRYKPFASAEYPYNNIILGYVAPSNTSTGAGTAENPWTGLQAPNLGAAGLGSGVTVIGTGDYFLDEYRSEITRQTCWWADGEVIMRPTNAGSQGVFFANDGGGSGRFRRFRGLTFFGYAPLHFQHGRNDQANEFLLDRCKIIGTSATSVNLIASSLLGPPQVMVTISPIDAIVKMIVSDETVTITAKYSIFYKCGNLHIQTAKNCYFDATATVICPANSLTNCNIRGPLIIDGINYDNLSAAIGAGKLDSTNINREPRFNKAEADDFTLLPDSPHLGAQIGPRHLRIGSGFYFDTDAQLNSETITTAQGQNSRLVGSADGQQVKLLSTSGFIANNRKALIVKANSNNVFEGTLRTSRIRLSDVDVELEAINYSGGYNFNVTTPAAENSFNSAQPETLNNNVPKFNQPAPGTAGRTPNRFTFLMRWSTLPDPDPLQDGDWVTGAAYVEFEYGVKPYWNGSIASPIGTGSASYDTDTMLQKVFCKFLQVQQRQRNNYYK